MRRKIEKEKEKDELANDCCDRKTLYSHSEFCSRKVFRDPGVEIRLSFGNFHSRILRSSSTLVAGLSADSELLRILFQRSDQSEKAVGASITVQRKEIFVHDSLCPPLEKPITKKEARFMALTLLSITPNHRSSNAGTSDVELHERANGNASSRNSWA
ncbi:hypothetical protein G5I_05882 [Acromyrmex echinatior]|uniref:Uncharacterized protein n=1 Tax=Acromyrmex echinatior TaxID=103372 RepID=F4WJK3_ACREC|nr:hypothetical protein G5I_05882 [Acromyrmex echinatior]